jgi:hypothetical protein
VPPQNDKTRYEAGEQLSFGLTLFGHALNLFPYVVMALRQAGSMGLGKRLPCAEANGRYLRGRFAVQSAQAINLLSGEVQDILQPNSTLVQRPDLPVTHAQVVEMSQRLLNFTSQPVIPNSQLSITNCQLPINLTLRFKTPTRLVSDKTLLKEPHFAPLFHRLLDRWLALSREFGARSPAGPVEFAHKNDLLALSDQVILVDNQTRWQEVWSYSARQQRKTPISGLVGQATYRASREIWEMLLPYLLWGSVIHIGKNAVKGDGIIKVEELWPLPLT